jgi:dCMP deaminase
VSKKWDVRFLQMAQLVSTWSRDPSTQCGAVIVRPDRTIQSVGFNGFPKQMPDRPEQYLDREEKYSRIVHAEMNALIHAGGPVTNCTLYTYPFCCCDRCTVQMIQAGILRFVFQVPPVETLQRWGAAFEKAKRYITESSAYYSEYGPDLSSPSISCNTSIQTLRLPAEL